MCVEARLARREALQEYDANEIVTLSGTAYEFAKDLIERRLGATYTKAQREGIVFDVTRRSLKPVGKEVRLFTTETIDNLATAQGKRRID